MDQYFNKTRVTFRFKSEANLGEAIKVVGNCEELGNWDPHKGVPLNTDPHSYPLWSSLPTALPMGSEIEYKYVYMSSENAVWESLPNRKLCTTNYKLRVEDQAGVFTSKHFYSKQEVNSLFKLNENYDFSYDEKVVFTHQDKVVIVSFRLPVQVTKSKEGNWDCEMAKGIWEPLLYEVAMQQNIDFTWVGWPGVFLDNPTEQEELSSYLFETYKCVPVFISSENFSLFKTFCGNLSRNLHSVYSTSLNPRPLWNAYKSVNLLFADKVVGLYTGQMIWVHDFHLCLVPSFISRKSGEVMNVGFYMHVPFPSSEVFRVHPNKEAILHGICSADVVGFHLFEYARHFVGACRRILNVSVEIWKGGFLGMNYFGRKILLKVSHLGIEPRVISECQKTQEYQELFESLKNKYKNKTVIIGFGCLNELSGITMKLEAIKHTLQSAKRKAKRVRFLEVIKTDSLTSSQEEQTALKEKVHSLKDQINRENKIEVVEVLEESLSNSSKFAYMAVSSGMVVCCAREGLCLLPMEYIYINKEHSRTVLSEFAGVSRALSSPKRVNPYNRYQLESAIFDLISGEKDQDIARTLRKDYEYIGSHTTSSWASKFLTDLKRAQKDTLKFKFVAHGLGDNMKLIALNKNFSKVNETRISESYKVCRNRLFMIAVEETIVDFSKSPAKANPSSKVLQVLKDLSQDEKNNIFLMSQTERSVMESWFGELQKVGLVAENGTFIKYPRETEWKKFGFKGAEWRSAAVDLTSSYVAKTEGASLTEKESSVTFQFCEADPEFGEWQAKELMLHLNNILKPNLGECEVVPGPCRIEVRPRGVSKSAALMQIISKVHERLGAVDFLLSVSGADDEIFTSIQKLIEQQSSFLAYGEMLHSYKVTVGIKPSLASYYVMDSEELAHLLDVLRICSHKVRFMQSKKFYSSNDLVFLDKDFKITGFTSRQLEELSEESSDELEIK